MGVPRHFQWYRHLYSLEVGRKLLPPLLLMCVLQFDNIVTLLSTGSSHYINTAISEGLIVVSGAAIMDMIGYSGTYFGVTVEYQGGSTGTALAQNAVENFNSYGIQGSNYGDGTKT